MFLSTKAIHNFLANISIMFFEKSVN